MSKVTEEPRCAECNVLTGYDHAPACSHSTREELLAGYRWIQGQFLEHSRRNHGALVRFREQATLWQGKFRIVAAENNALRRKNAALTKEVVIVTAERNDAQLKSKDPLALAARLEALAERARSEKWTEGNVAAITLEQVARELRS